MDCARRHLVVDGITGRKSAVLDEGTTQRRPCPTSSCQACRSACIHSSFTQSTERRRWSGGQQQCQHHRRSGLCSRWRVHEQFAWWREEMGAFGR